MYSKDRRAALMQMDSFVRVLKSPLKISAAAYYRSLINKINEPVVHRTVNLGVYTSGKGDFGRAVYGDREYKCAYPYVFVEIPGVPSQYLSSHPREIFYYNYNPKLTPLLESLGLEMRAEAWEIRMTDSMSAIIKEAGNILGNIYKKGAADRLDLLCGELTLEIIRSRISKDEINPDESHRRVEKIQNVLNSRFRESISLEKLAFENGMTLRTLRRQWDKYYPVPMKHFILIKRIDEARRLLETTAEPIGKIAGLCGFDNPLYFSRKFHGMTGLSPLGHRNKFRL
jgi:AraC-like DNA-binding protein